MRVGQGWKWGVEGSRLICERLLFHLLPLASDLNLII
mgnify:CR=1 FL=1